MDERSTGTYVSADSLSTLLLLSSIVSAAMLLVLLMSKQSLGSESRGTGAWILGDSAHAAARGLLVGSLTPSFLDVWERHLGSFPQHQLAGSLHMVGFWCQWLALRRLAGAGTGRPWHAALAGLGVFACSDVLIGAIPSTAGRKTVALVFVVLFSALLFRAAWPLARRSWGARMLLLGTGFTTVSVAARLLAPAFTGHLGTAFGEMTQEREFIGELVYSLSATMAFVLMQQERLRERIFELSVTDALTGAFNRHGLLPILERELTASHRKRQPLSVVLFDLDHFKRINDQYGHNVGDIVLRGVVKIIKANIRSHDALCRWGGEEFLLMLPGRPGDVATVVARRIVEALREVRIDAGADLQLAVTISAGVAEVEPDATGADESTSLDPLIAMADSRLYLAKVRRNCVVSHLADESTLKGEDRKTPALAS